MLFLTYRNEIMSFNLRFHWSVPGAIPEMIQHVAKKPRESPYGC